MKKWFMIMTVVLLSALVACSGGDDNEDTDETGTKNGDKNEEQTIKVAVVESPMLDVVEIAQEILAEDDVDLEIVEMGDYIQPNEALENEEVDANFSQHVPFMNQFNEGTDANLTDIQPIYFANFGLYAQEYEHVEEFPDDATIGMANDPSNIDRTLRLLASHDLIELNDTDSDQYGLDDIDEDSHNYSFEEAGIDALTRLYEDVDGIIVNPTHAQNLDLTPADDALITEKEDNKFAITLVAREDNADSELIQKLSDAMTSDDVEEFLNSREGEAAIPAF